MSQADEALIREIDRLKAENARLIELSHEAADKLHEMSIRALKAEDENARLRAALEAADEKYKPLVDEVEKRLQEYPRCFDLSVERGLREALAKTRSQQ